MTVSMPGYAAVPHLVYTQHVAMVTPTAAVQALLPEVMMPTVTPPPGFAAPAAAPDFWCPKSSPLDLPPVQRMLLVSALPPVPEYSATPVLVPVPAAVIPAHGVAAPTPGPSGQLNLESQVVSGIVKLAGVESLPVDGVDISVRNDLALSKNVNPVVRDIPVPERQ
ncbi:uncharacterized protein LOC135211974 [Macrobrachium nipponense]|uniref:uncharacterized protein LOC135211974 n=1 Tax=Macrobrachium nipponense TaxID=159736 RepID=UPI0030C7B9B3